MQFPPSSSIARRVRSYTCIFCEYQRLTKPYLSTRRWIARTSNRSPTEAAWPETQFKRRQGRRFRQSRSLTTVEGTLPSQSEKQVPEYAFVVKPRQRISSKTSQIRESLRAWSDQNHRMKQDQTLDTLPYEGKIKKLPNSLFVDPEQYAEASEDKRDFVDTEEALWRDEDDGGAANGTMVSPGTLFSHKSYLVPQQNVVYLGELGIQSLLLLSDGRWAAETIEHRRTGFSTSRQYTVPHFLTPAEVDKLRAHMPQKPVMRAVTENTRPVSIGVTGTIPDVVAGPMLQKLKAHNRAEYQFLKYNRPKLEQMYDLVAYEDKWRIIPLKDLSRLALGVNLEDLTDADKKSFVSYANVFHPMFTATQTAMTVAYCVAPKALHDTMKVVQEWARLYQEAAAQAAVGKDVADLLRNNPLSSFIDKARRVIVKSRKIRSPTSMGLLGPSLGLKDGEQAQPIPTGADFTSDDLKIIRYLWDLALRRPASRQTKAHAALIVRAIGAYPDMQLDSACVRMLLGEIGCIDPWAMFEDLAAPIPGRRATNELDELRQKALKSAGSLTHMIDRVSDQMSDSSHTTRFPDSMAHMRKDWGEMLAFAVDMRTAINVEDALSVEPADEKGERYWIHTHFAHPTAHFDADHPISQYARKCGASHYSLYGNESVNRMVPAAVVNQFTLNNRNANPVLTVSTLLGSDGQVHEIKIVPGILRNLKRLDRAAVDALMGAEHNDKLSILVVGKLHESELLTVQKGAGGHNTNLKEDMEHASQFLPQLNLLADLLMARRARREAEVETPGRFFRVVGNVRARIALPGRYSPDRELRSYHWKGDPGIAVVAPPRLDVTTTADQTRGRDLIAQAMRLSGESLGKWLKDRNIPAVFLGCSPAPGFSIEDMNTLNDQAEVVKPIYMRAASPLPHVAYNMKQYAACSSPLRKYIDMINHFQIDSYLKAEAQGFVECKMPVEDESILAFSKAGVEDYVSGDISASDSLENDTVESRNFWTCQALFRAFHFQETSIPETMEVLINTPMRRNALGVLEPARGVLVPWQVTAVVEPSVEGYEMMAETRSWLPVKLENVNPYRRLVTVRAVGPPSPQQQLLEPLECYNLKNIIAE